MGWFEPPPPVDENAPWLAKLGGSPSDLFGYLLAFSGAVTLGAFGMSAAERVVWGKERRRRRGGVTVVQESGPGHAFVEED